VSSILTLVEVAMGLRTMEPEYEKENDFALCGGCFPIKNNAGKLVASAPELIRHYMELRGIGVIDVRRLFGMGAIKDSQEIDLVINLEPWKEGKVYDRLGMDSTYVEILDTPLPSLTIPVKPGRNLASILEVAAMNNRNRKMGHNAALELSQRMDSHWQQN